MEACSLEKLTSPPKHKKEQGRIEKKGLTVIVEWRCRVAIEGYGNEDAEEHIMSCSLFR